MKVFNLSKAINQQKLYRLKEFALYCSAPKAGNRVRVPYNFPNTTNIDLLAQFI